MFMTRPYQPDRGGLANTITREAEIFAGPDEITRPRAKTAQPRRRCATGGQVPNQGLRSCKQRASGRILAAIHQGDAMNKDLFSKGTLAALLIAALGIAGCASTPPAPPEAQPPAADGAAPKPHWDVASEKEVADKLDLAVEKAAKEYVQLKKDGVLMFCKRRRQIGSNIPTIECITEAQLRTRVENMTKYRDDMRNRGGKCVHGQGCSSGG
jgi:hypothetical protein